MGNASVSCVPHWFMGSFALLHKFQHRQAGPCSSRFHIYCVFRGENTVTPSCCPSEKSGKCALDSAKATTSDHQWIQVHGRWQATCYPWVELNLLSHILPSNAAWKGRNPITNKFTHLLTFSCWEWWVMFKLTCSVVGPFLLPIFLKICSG